MAIIFPSLRVGVAIVIFVKSLSYFDCTGRTLPRRIYLALVLIFIFTIVLGAREGLRCSQEILVATLFLYFVGYEIKSVLSLHAEADDRAKLLRLDFEELSDGPYVT